MSNNKNISLKKINQDADFTEAIYLVTLDNMPTFYTKVIFTHELWSYGFWANGLSSEEKINRFKTITRNIIQDYLFSEVEKGPKEFKYFLNQDQEVINIFKRLI